MGDAAIVQPASKRVQHCLDAPDVVLRIVAGVVPHPNGLPYRLAS
jgi:hypothetical protein